MSTGKGHPSANITVFCGFTHQRPFDQIGFYSKEYIKKNGMTVVHAKAEKLTRSSSARFIL